ncbi:hypothetical protein A2956_02475 [Candidatus Roizmanbacteria bacterium RIFCSPLOWO2_01_FULL_37_57]|nr:MAG: hypothetical protein A2956_02475 [Candidatus Roizmanbacteria bacterium RIFCSPLOWO2_01_FULL_37_57]
MKDDRLPELITLKQASGILKCHPNTLRKWDADGTLKAVRFGQRGDRRYKKNDLVNFIRNHNNE